MGDDVVQFIRDHEGFQLNKEKTRVICEITGHEVPCNVAAILAYINGKKYKQLTKNGACKLSILAEYKEYLIPSRNKKNMLYCLVTKKEINNIPSHIENHVKGRKFQRDLKIYKANHEISKQQDDFNDPQPGTHGSKNVASSEENLDDEMLEEKDEDILEEDLEEDGAGEELERGEDEGFSGGIWYPEVMDLDEKHPDDDQIDMDDEKSGNEIKRTSKGMKNNLKRKIKNNKKSKLSMAVNQKKKR